MIPRDNLLLKAKTDVYHRLLGDEALANVSILLNDEHDLDDRTRLDAGPGNERNGKIGACIIVDAIGVTRVGTANTPMPLMDISVEIEIVEDVLVNAGDYGTGMNAGEIAARLVQSLHLSHFDDRFTGLALSEKAPIQEFLRERDKVGQRAYLVRFDANSTAFAIVDTCADVRAAVATGLCTLTTATSGATIYYTLDGSYPGSGNPDALTYSAPFEVESGDQVRAAAEKSGSNASKNVLFHAI